MNRLPIWYLPPYSGTLILRLQLLTVRVYLVNILLKPFKRLQQEGSHLLAAESLLNHRHVKTHGFQCTEKTQRSCLARTVWVPLMIPYVRKNGEVCLGVKIWEPRLGQNSHHFFIFANCNCRLWISQ